MDDMPFDDRHDNPMWAEQYYPQHVPVSVPDTIPDWMIQEQN